MPEEPSNPLPEIALVAVGFPALSTGTNTPEMTTLGPSEILRAPSERGLFGALRLSSDESHGLPASLPSKQQPVGPPQQGHSAHRRNYWKGEFAHTLTGSCPRTLNDIKQIS